MSEKLRTYRTEHKLTQEAIGQIAGVSSEMISLIENGKRGMSPDIAEKLEHFTQGALNAYELLGIEPFQNTLSVTSDPSIAPQHTDSTAGVKN